MAMFAIPLSQALVLSVASASFGLKQPLGKFHEFPAIEVEPVPFELADRCLLSYSSVS